MKRTNIFFTFLQLERLQSIANQTGLPVAELVRRAVDAYLKKEEK